MADKFECPDCEKINMEQKAIDGEMVFSCPKCGLWIASDVVRDMIADAKAIGDA
jgi:predicted RNA-binding Zn-ribbon protein involved in translation (DUF1610 family)